MKKLLLFCAMLMGMAAYAQFPGANVELLLNTTVKPKEKSKTLQEFGYANFYTEFDKQSGKLEKNKKKTRAFPQDAYRSKYDELVGKEFTVTNVYKGDFSAGYVLELKSDELGILYYDYNANSDATFELDIVSELQLPAGFYCKDIHEEYKKDEAKTVKIVGPVRGFYILYMKYDNGDEIISMRATLPSKELDVKAKGMVLTLADGQKIEKPDSEVKVEVGDYGNYTYTTMILLTEEEALRIINNRITEKKIGPFSSTVETEAGTKISEYFKCILNKG